MSRAFPSPSFSNVLRLSVVLLLLVAVPLPLLGQGAPVSGKATINGSLTPETPVVNGMVSMAVTVDLTGVVGQGAGGTTPAVLGAYQVAVTFDKTKVRFEEASGGTSTGYSSAPTATGASTANANGRVVIAASQTNSDNPKGKVKVAVLKFKALAKGNAAFTLEAYSLSTAFQPPSHGPSSIDSNGSSTSVTIYELPGMPTGLKPADGASGVALPVTLEWNAAADTTRYDVYLGMAKPPAFLGSTGANSLPANLETGTTYYWRVVAVNPAGSTSTAVIDFTTAGPTPCRTPDAPHLTAPTGATSGEAFRIAWNPVANASEYRLEESTTTNFATPAVTTIPAPATEVVVTKTVAQATTWYYRLSARNLTGGCNLVSGWSPVVAVEVSPAAGPQTYMRVVPVVSSTSGVGGAYFRTAVQMHNFGSTTETGRMTFHPAGTPGSDSDPGMDYSVEPGQTIAIPDLVAAMGQSGAGSLDIKTQSSFPVMVFRIFNDGGATGTTGLMTEALRPEEALVAGDIAYLLGPADPLAARLNVGVRTLAQGATLEITQKASNGQVIRTLTREYPPNYFTQVNDGAFVESAGSLAASDILMVRVAAGSAFIYGATTDNKTQDPSVQIARRVN